jgi:6-pyruvoyltetrahydropterin/6-carboxytetrahydropterin synthase
LEAFISSGVPVAVIETYKEFSFEAAHKVPPYSDVHGHSFRVCVSIHGEPDATYGWSANLYEVETQIEKLQGEIDHRYLNDIEGLEMPSLENLAKWLFDKFDGHIHGLESIHVSRGASGQAEGCIYRRPATAKAA